MEHLPVELRERLQYRTVMLVKQPIRHVQSIIWIDADQVCIERRVMDLGQRQAIRHDRLPKPLVLVRYDVRSVEQSLFGQSR